MTKRVVLIELANHVACLDSFIEAGDVLVGMTLEAGYELERAGYKYSTFDQYFTFEEYYSALGKIEDYCDHIASICDSVIDKIDPRYREAGLAPFHLHRYDLEYYLGDFRAAIFKLEAIYKKEKPSSFIMIRTTDDLYDKALGYGIVRDTCLQHMLPLVTQTWGIEYEFIPDMVEGSGSVLSKKNGKSKLSKLLYAIKRHSKKLSRLLYAIKRHIKKLPELSCYFVVKHLFLFNKKCLSLKCRDIEYLSLPLLGKGWRVYSFPMKNLKTYSSIRFIYKYRFLNGIDQYSQEFVFHGCDFFPLFQETIPFLLDKIEQCLSLVFDLEKYISENKYNAVAFFSHSTAEPEHVLLPALLKKRGIPYFCWMHGFYGANNTHSGYKFTDLTFSENYFVYGSLVKKQLEIADSSFTGTCHIAGASRIESFFRKYKPPKNKKKIIVLVLCSLNVNRKALNLNSPDDHVRFWPAIRKILELVIKYQDEYRIILRPNDFNGQETVFLRKFLDDHGGSSVEILGLWDCNLPDLYKKMDLCILFWASTTLIEACCTSADVFLYDRSDLTEEAKQLLSSRVVFDDKLDKFIKKLKTYLDNGTFPRQHTDQFLKAAIDWGNKSVRTEKVAYILNTLNVDGKKEVL